MCFIQGFLSPHPQIHKLSLPILSVSDCGDNEKASETTETGDNEMASEAPETASDCGLKELDPFPEQFVVCMLRMHSSLISFTMFMSVHLSVMIVLLELRFLFCL